MCDFRKSPYQVKNLETGDVVNIDHCYLASYNKHISICTHNNVIYNTNDPSYNIGVYRVCATGSFYSYYDGKNWYRDGEQYKFFFYEDNAFC